MVKRTLVVLGILSLLVVGAGTSDAFVGGGWDSCYSPPPLFVPVPCPTYPDSKTIVKTWSCKIEGPCPPPFGGYAGGGSGFGPAPDPYGPFSFYGRIGLRGGIVAALATPFDMLFGGFDGVYGCTFDGQGDGACGPCFGPIPCVASGLAMTFAAPTVIFGGLW